MNVEGIITWENNYLQSIDPISGEATGWKVVGEEDIRNSQNAGLSTTCQLHAHT